MYKLIKLITILFSSKFVFQKPQNKKFLIFDNDHHQHLLRYFKKNEYSILYTRNEVFNIYIIIRNFLNFKFSKLEYYNTYLEFVDPNFLISFKDNDPLFFMIKKKRFKKILIQNGWKDSFNDRILNSNYFLKLKKSFNLDFFLTYNIKIGLKYKKISNCYLIPIGSFKSNNFKIKKKLKKKKDILYISNFQNSVEKLKKNMVTKDISGEQFDKPQRELLKTLDEYTKNNNLKLLIYGRCRFTKRIKEEKKYYSTLLRKCNWKFIKNDQKKNFTYIDRSSLVVTINSTLGYESFSRKIKTVFFNIRPKNKELSPIRFGWPSLKKDKGTFWINSLDYKKVEKFLNKVRGFSDPEWRKITEKYKKNLMLRDENNSKFLKLINI